MPKNTNTISRYAPIVLIAISMFSLLGGCDFLSRATPLPAGETIAEIQGVGHRSPFEKRPVYHVHGVVTAIRADGFYMQSLTPDDDPATSEGIFVFKGLVPAVKPGDEVLVNAMVEEMVPGGSETGNLSITQLENPYVEVISQGNDLPEPLIIGVDGRMPPAKVIDDDTQGEVSENGVFDPENDGLDFFESLEGMRVQVNNAVVVGATNQYKEITILADQGNGASIRTPRGGIVLRKDDFNPERIILDDTMRQMPFVQVGDFATTPIIGVMDYTYGNFKLQPTQNVKFSSGGLQPDEPLRPALPGQLRVANYNVQNLTAGDKERIETLADQIVNVMSSPDVIGLQEVQDDDGSTSTQAISADETFGNLIDAIHVLGGPEYGFVDIDPVPEKDGGIPGGNIRVGFLYRLDRGIALAEAPIGDAETPVEVNPEGSPTLLSLNPGRIDPTNIAFADSRKPLTVEFVYQGRSLVMINNHFNSKSGDLPLFGEKQPPELVSETQRLQQAKVVHQFVDELLTLHHGARVIVMGDLNDFYFAAPVEVLKEDILINLVESLPVEERYTYIYDGNSQVLDHILVSEGLFQSLTAMDILHINSEFDYLHRFSDHDILVATFEIQ